MKQPSYQDLNALHPAFLFWVDFMDGSIEVTPYLTVDAAKGAAKAKNDHNEALGQDDVGQWYAVDELPRKRIYAVRKVVAL